MATLTLRALRRPPIVPDAKLIGTRGRFELYRASNGQQFAKIPGSGRWFRVVTNQGAESK